MPILKQAKRIVVKVGTSTLTYETGKTNIRRMAKLVSVLSDLLNSGMEVVLVTSGAIGVGVESSACASDRTIRRAVRQRQPWGNAS